MVTKVRLSTNLSKVNGVSVSNSSDGCNSRKNGKCNGSNCGNRQTEREMATKLKDITAETMKTNVTAKTIVTNK